MIASVFPLSREVFCNSRGGGNFVAIASRLHYDSICSCCPYLCSWIEPDRKCPSADESGVLTEASSAQRLFRMRLVSPAKVNLHLRVGPPSSDGFHPLLSWFCTIGLFDTLTLSRCAPSDAGRTETARTKTVRTETAQAAPNTTVIRLSTDVSDLPTDDRNLIVRVAKALADTSGPDSTARRDEVSAFLEKRIPMGAGLGGGSSNAATALLGLNNLWGIGWSAQRLSDFSRSFGSDIPFFFHGPSSICTGRGEIVRPIAPPRARWAVVMLPRIHMTTPAVYRRFDEMKLGEQSTINAEPDWNAWSQLISINLLPRLVNDLESPAFSLSPELRELHQRVEQALGRIVRMSGSGSSLFTLFDSQHEAEQAAAKVRDQLNVSTQALELAPKQSGDLHV
ncbi:MAG TPA: 4-(cytidine 5'-diphospho)-2-C-methyl-D-erythritol kinase [Tepidisphaeraceae bacterium]